MASVALIGAVYGVSYVLVYLDGPFDIFERLRGLKWLREFGILECLPCTAFWVSLVIGYQQGVVGMLGIWGACIIADNVNISVPAVYIPEACNR
jgi:hypothetical protein